MHRDYTCSLCKNADAPSRGHDLKQLINPMEAIKALDAPSRGINYFPLFSGVSWRNTNPTPLTGQNNKCAYGKIYPARVPGGIYFDFI